ncbi:MAG: two-component sensor histidine kinase [Desulfobacteraceae bacterium]|nr:MAG: two-component sensor histidine kinase [Desulfobacteraceae bacterium]
MFVRVVFTAILLGATLIFQMRHRDQAVEPVVTIFYFLIAAVFFLSILYGMIFQRVKRQALFAYIQIGIDSFVVSLIILITGGFYSMFSFLYLVVIIYASMILYMKGGIALALISSLQFAGLISLQFLSIIPFADAVEGSGAFNPTIMQIIYKVLITSSACFAVAFLSGLLTEQNRKSQHELRAMEDHVKRVEKMAYMGEMAAGLAHEIKNPLASLVGSIQLLREDLHYDQDHQRLMEIVLRETDRLSTLVNEFLLFARPPAGKPEMLHLQQAIEEITSLFERDTNHCKRFSLKKALDPDVHVVMDPAHLRQVLWNLLLNAAEAVSPGGSIALHTIALKNNEVSIQVHDDGCGMPPEVAGKIFNPFFTTKPDGTGLGLSIVHRILEAYESRLDVQTELGCGTTFSFSLKRSGKIR